MKNLLFVPLLLAASMALAPAAPAPKPTRVPPPGIAIAEKDRTELRAGADALAKEIAALRSSPMNALLPDVEIFHKAVDWPLRYDEFYRSNEVGLARLLLKEGMERARQLRDGQPSWITATGLVVRGYVSKIDGSIQPYGLVVPATWATNRTRARRLDVWLHGRDNHLTELKFIADRQRSYGEFAPANAFVLHPYGRYCNAFKFAGEIDVFEAMEHVKKSYQIDQRRIAIRGFSMGGAGTWHLAAHYPDVWAVAAPGAGFAETAQYTKALSKDPKPSEWEQKLWQLYDATDYAANFFNLPVIAYDGSDDPQRQAADVMERAMKAEGLVLGRVHGLKVGHKYTPEAKKDLNNFVDGVMTRGKYPAPRTVHFTTRTTRYNQGPYITVARLERHWERADVHVRIAMDYSVTVKTTNVAELWLDLPNRGVDNSQLTIDGQLVQRSGPGNSMAVVLFPRLAKSASGQWTQIIEPNSEPRLAKIHGLQGPIDDAFMDSFVVVRPTSAAPNEKVGAWVSAELAKATNEWRAQFRGDARVKDDTQVTEADIAANHLVLFGDPKSNRLLARIADKLPVQWKEELIRLGDKTFPAATHVPVFIFPNPLNPKRYVVVNSGFTFAAAGSGSNAQQTPKLPDYAVLDLEKNGVAMAGFFDEEWQWR
jgi:pimeloyl-ACP methyl ester carboxylesterase